MKHAIRYTLPDKSQVFYSVERGDYGAKKDCTLFAKAPDARMVMLRLRDDLGVSIKRLEVVHAPI